MKNILKSTVLLVFLALMLPGAQAKNIFMLGGDERDGSCCNSCSCGSASSNDDCYGKTLSNDGLGGTCDQYWDQVLRERRGMRGDVLDNDYRKGSCSLDYCKQLVREDGRRRALELEYRRSLEEKMRKEVVEQVRKEVLEQVKKELELEDKGKKETAEQQKTASVLTVAPETKAEPAKEAAK